MVTTTLKNFASQHSEQDFFVLESPIGGHSLYRSKLQEDWLDNSQDFKLTENGCFFRIGDDIDYYISFKEFPVDKWGNTQTHQDIFTSKDCFVVYSNDAGYKGFYGLDYEHPEFIKKNNLEEKFREWFERYWESYDFIDKITDDGQNWQYLTSNKSLDSQEWKQLFKDFEVHCNL